MRTHGKRSRTALCGVGIGVTALLLAGCGGQSDGGGSSSSAPPEGGDTPAEGLPFGATKEDYQKAFEDIEPIKLRTQVSQAQGGFANVSTEAFVAALDEWSGGKIQVEIGYANAFVPDATQWDDALADGRLDIGYFITSYEPDIFPLANSVSDATQLDPTSPTSTLIGASWASEILLGDEQFIDEVKDEGIQYLLPGVPAVNFTALLCANPADGDPGFDGRVASVSGTGKTAAAEALGMAPVAMPFTEQYEALERGAINCAVTSIVAADAGGLVPLVPNIYVSDQTSISFPLYSLGVNVDRWESLPLVAQQLIFDKLDEIMKNETIANYARIQPSFDLASTSGGGVFQLGPAAVTAVDEANEKLYAGIESAGFDFQSYRDASAKWTGIVDDDLGLGTDQDFGEWVRAGEFEAWDLQGWSDRMFDEVLLAHRPGS
ncbi:hypothetical protein [Microbacterium sp. No. 7]|uniref:hypothetical protein n=1 Tax=Microbacterium sp. No. 7 TaxID=1714373 RepID=UPI0006D17650|nr:hypothetical protein [Microbacterium sp. No. 7]ALJ18812.1 hypothetical protein AOA12_02340 [Microbacterium sp. No. 7]